MEFQDADPEFKIPFDLNDHSPSPERNSLDSSKIFLYNYFFYMHKKCLFICIYIKFRPKKCKAYITHKIFLPATANYACFD